MDIESTDIAHTRTDAAEYLHSSGVGIYVADKRPRNDTFWTVAYCLLAALAVLWGIPAFIYTDPNAGLYTNRDPNAATPFTGSFYYSSSSCDFEAYQAANPPAGENDSDRTFTRAFKKAISIWLPITAVLAVVSSVVYLFLFRRFAKAMIAATIVGSLTMGVLFAVVCFATGAVPFGIILLVVTVITALFYWWIRDQLKMCAELLAIAGRSLNENLALVPAALGINFVGVCVLIYAFAAFFSAFNVGRPERNPLVATSSGPPEQAACWDTLYNQIPCCAFKTQTWAGVYAFIAAIFISWTAMLVMQVKLYTVADTTAQWYFSSSTAGSAYSSAAVGTVGQTSGSVRLALRHCLSTSFGSITFAAAILAVLRAIRSILERAARNNIICCIINCIVQPLLAMMEKFTRFATIATAITGQAFVPAAKAVFDTLKRNFLQTYSLWWVPDMVLQFAVTLLSLSWGGIVFFATYAANKDSDDTWGISFATAAVAFLFMLYTLLFVAGLLLDTVNTLYICYAMDKDNRRVTHPEIHAVYMKVPGLAVENPDGAVMYGSPDMNQRQQPAPAPPPYAGMYPPQQQANAGYPPPPPPGGYSYVQSDRL